MSKTKDEQMRVGVYVYLSVFMVAVLSLHCAKEKITETVYVLVEGKDTGEDTTPPMVKITSPLPGERVQARRDAMGDKYVRIYFTVTDDTKIERVVSEGIIGPGVLRKWEANALHYKRLEYFFTHKPGGGNYSRDLHIAIIAYDEAGNRGSAEVRFSVNW